jgi:hypothetical protein
MYTAVERSTSTPFVICDGPHWLLSTIPLPLEPVRVKDAVFEAAMNDVSVALADLQSPLGE